MIYSKAILPGVAWKQYRLHVGPWMRRNGWMVGLQLETLGPSERRYRFSFSRPALVSVKCSLRAMWLSQRGSKPHPPCCPMKTLGGLSVKKTNGPPLKTWQRSPASPTLAVRQNRVNHTLSWHLWCCDSDRPGWNSLSSPRGWGQAQEAQLGKSSGGGSWMQRQHSTVGVNILSAWGRADSKGEASIRLGFLLLYIWLLSPWACPM